MWLAFTLASENQSVEVIRVIAVTTCAKNDSSCPVYTGALGLFDTDGTLVATFPQKDDRAVVKVVRGKYSIKSVSSKTCIELSGKVETSTGVMNEVMITCPST